MREWIEIEEIVTFCGLVLLGISVYLALGHIAAIAYLGVLFTSIGGILTWIKIGQNQRG